MRSVAISVKLWQERMEIENTTPSNSPSTSTSPSPRKKKKEDESDESVNTSEDNDWIHDTNFNSRHATLDQIFQNPKIFIGLSAICTVK